jgi:hypothetical protein
MLNDFIKDNISKITNAWTFIFYLVIEELKHYNPLVSIIFSLLSLSIFHYISLLKAEKSLIESELNSIKSELNSLKQNEVKTEEEEEISKEVV